MHSQPIGSKHGFVVLSTPFLLHHSSSSSHLSTYIHAYSRRSRTISYIYIYTYISKRAERVKTREDGIISEGGREGINIRDKVSPRRERRIGRPISLAVKKNLFSANGRGIKIGDKVCTARRGDVISGGTKNAVRRDTLCTHARASREWRARCEA